MAANDEAVDAAKALVRKVLADSMAKIGCCPLGCEARIQRRLLLGLERLRQDSKPARKGQK